MAMWEVPIQKTFYGHFYVEAETRDEAEQIAWKTYDDYLNDEETWDMEYDLTILKPRKSNKNIKTNSSTRMGATKRYVKSNYISCAERFDPVNSSPEELIEYIYDALDETFDETNFVEEDLEQYKDTFTNELIKALNRLNLGDMQVETDFGTLTGDTKKIANTVVKAYIQAYKDGRLG